MALLGVLVLLVVVTASSVSFIWFMNQQQTRAGTRYRSAAAVALAEAGVYRALSILESPAPDGSLGRGWRPVAYSETHPAGPLEGRFSVSVTDDADGSVIVTSTGDVAGVIRRLRARVYLASPAQLVGLYGTSFVRLEKSPAATFILPYGAGIGDRPWTHIAAGQGLVFATSEVSINEPSAVFDIGPGPVDALREADNKTKTSRPEPVRLLLGPGAELMLGQEEQRVDFQQLRTIGVYVEGVVLRTEALPRLPEVDRVFFQAQAATNTANASLNEAAGRYLGDVDLAGKRDSLYSSAQIEQLLTYLRAGRQPPRFVGAIYVTGGLALLGSQQLLIADGSLVTENMVHLSEGASLEIIHSAATRTLPGLIVLDRGGLAVTRGARLRVHGLVYVNHIFDVGEQAHVDVVGSVLGNDSELSFSNFAGTVVIRYDPAVLGTPGLINPGDARAVAWVAAWEELP